jgi:hypothetical protein
MAGSIGVQMAVDEELYMMQLVKIMFVQSVKEDAQKRNYYEEALR